MTQETSLADCCRNLLFKPCPHGEQPPSMAAFCLEKAKEEPPVLPRKRRCGSSEKPVGNNFVH